MEDLRINIIFNNFTRSKFNKLEISIRDEKYIMSKRLRNRIAIRNIFSFIIIGLLIFLSRFYLEPVLGPIITKTGALLVFLILNVIFIYIISYLLIPKDLSMDLSKMVE